MIGAITSFLTKPRTLNADLELDHVELTGDALILGLQVTWRNDMPKLVEFQEVFVNLFDKGPTEPPVLLTYLERFARIPYQKGITKIVGAYSFPVQAHATRVEHLRFMTRDLIDLPDGKHEVELHSVIADGTFVHDFILKVTPELKIRPAPAGPQATPLSTAILTRARRISPE